MASWSSRSRGKPRSCPSLRMCLHGTRFLRRPSSGTRDHLAPQSGQSQFIGSTETTKRPAAIHPSCERESRTEALASSRRSSRSCRRASVVPFLTLALSAALLALRSTRLIPLVRMCPTRTSEYELRRGNGLFYQGDEFRPLWANEPAQEFQNDHIVRENLHFVTTQFAAGSQGSYDCQQFAVNRAFATHGGRFRRC